MEIKVSEILYQPRIEKNDIIKVEIYGELYSKIITPPNVFVIKTNTELIENNEHCLYVYPSIIFEKDNIIFELTNVIVKHKEDMCFLECKHWKETFLEVDIL